MAMCEVYIQNGDRDADRAPYCLTSILSLTAIRSSLGVAIVFYCHVDKDDLESR